MFAASKRQGAIFSPAIKPLDKGKEKMNEDIQHQHDEEREFELIHVDSEEEEKISSLFIQNKNAQIRDLQADLERAKYKYDVLDREIRQRSAHMEIYEVRALRVRRQAIKAEVKL